MRRRDVLTLTALPLVLAAPASHGAEPKPQEPLAQRLRAGRVVLLLRHATTDAGIGDPPGFRLGDCTTQRNLSDEGRAQARRIGAWFSARGLKPSQVRSSAWCRCIDTGTLAFGRTEHWEALNSFFDDASTRARQSATLAAALPGVAAGTFEVWVTHQVNITALTGAYAQMGEGCLVEPAAKPGAALRVVAPWRADA